MTIKHCAHRVIYYRRIGEYQLADLFILALRLLLLEKKIAKADI
jgi:hypothetical protein